MIKNKKKTIILSDLHGNTAILADLLEKYDYIIQNGDFGYDYSCLKDIPKERLVINYGNHENHPQIKNYPHFLSPYGMKEFGGLKFYNLSGAFSIDWKIRVEREWEWGKTWFEQEELSQYELEEAVRLYKDSRPNIVIAHEAPRSIVNIVGNSIILKNWGFDPQTFTTKTSEALDRCINEHMPSLFIFGHYHLNFDQIINGCRFICQEELGYLDLSLDLSIVKYTRNGEEYV